MPGNLECKTHRLFCQVAQGTKGYRANPSTSRRSRFRALWWPALLPLRRRFHHQRWSCPAKPPEIWHPSDPHSGPQKKWRKPNGKITGKSGKMRILPNSCGFIICFINVIDKKLGKKQHSLRSRLTWPLLRSATDVQLLLFVLVAQVSTAKVAILGKGLRHSVSHRKYMKISPEYVQKASNSLKRLEFRLFLTSTVGLISMDRWTAVAVDLDERKVSWNSLASRFISGALSYPAKTVGPRMQISPTWIMFRPSQWDYQHCHAKSV